MPAQFRHLSWLAVALLLIGGRAGAQVQTNTQPAESAGAAEPGGAPVEEVVVTARKRNESALDVPVSVTAISSADLAKYNNVDLISLASNIPGLTMGLAGGGAGGSVALRGISSSTDNSAIEQAVSFNIDGIQVGSANIARLAAIDMQDVQIFKGPQSLLFGKDSPAGIIAMRTADPGDHFETAATVSHEFNARENTGQFSVSTPVTDQLGVRLAGILRNMSGYIIDDAPIVPGLAYGPASSRLPRQTEAAGRITVVYHPLEDLRVRIKYTYGTLDSTSALAQEGRIACPNGAPQVFGLPSSVALSACKPSDVIYNGQTSPLLIGLHPDLISNDKQDSVQQLGSGEITYDLLPDITLSSLSGVYQYQEDYASSDSFGPASLLATKNVTYRHEFSQELRLTTSRADWPVNFTLGGYFQNSDFSVAIPVVIDNYLLGAAATPGQGAYGVNNVSKIHGTTSSAFGQAIWKIVSSLELAGGVRWSREHKQLLDFTNGQPVAVVDNDKSWTNFSPEATLTWRPLSTLALFGAFRTGFTAGGYNAGLGASLSDISYKPETVRGGELGVKINTGRLRYNAAAYLYNYNDMQVSAYNNATFSSQVSNAATVRGRGIEQDVAWAPPAIKGLELHGTLNYNNTYYGRFLGACYTGQTIAMGCGAGSLIGGQYFEQDLAGHRLLLAPEWTGNVGFNFTTEPLFAKYIVTVTGDANYTSPFDTQIQADPLARAQTNWKLNASIRLANVDETWELALIGENLANVFVPNYSVDTPFTGNPAYTGTNNPGGLSDVIATIDRPRQIRLQLAIHMK